MTTERQYPLANDINGEPIDVPPEAVAWRVRRRSGKQGRPQNVFDPATGTPLEVDLESEIDELRPSGPGGYRLDGIDANGKLVPGVTAYVEVPADEQKTTPPESPTETATALREVTQLLRETVQANCRTMEAMATAFGPVRPAAAVQEQPFYMMSPTVIPAADQKPADLMSKMMEFMPMLNGFMQMLPQFFQMFKGAAAGVGGVAPDMAAAAAAVVPTEVMS